MDMHTLTSFFMWCTIINGGIFVVWAVLFLLMPDVVYRTQRVWFEIPRQTFDIIFYSFLGLFKICFLFFNVVPYMALLIIA